jgi:hypothetical protein
MMFKFVRQLHMGGYFRTEIIENQFFSARPWGFLVSRIIARVDLFTDCERRVVLFNVCVNKLLGAIYTSP